MLALLSNLASVTAAAPPLIRHITRHDHLPPPLLLVDANNLRGYAVFSLSISQLCERVDAFATMHSVPTILAIDHGSEQRAWRLGPYAVAALSGPRQSADDALVRDAHWALSARREVVMFTSDAGLTGRARRLSSVGTIQVLPSSALGVHLCDQVELKAGKRGESTRERSVAAERLLASVDACPPAGATAETVDRVLAAYMEWLPDAPQGAVDPHVPSPSMKRRLRRKRSMRPYFHDRASDQVAAT